MAAAATVGVVDITFLRYDDGDLAFHVPRLRADVTRLIGQHRPRTIITHDPYPGNGSHDACAIIYPDHTTLELTVFDAAYLCAPSPLCEPDQVRQGLPLHRQDVLMLSMSQEPDVFVDIESVFALRMQALRKHVTQGRDRPEQDAVFRHIATELGRRGGYRLAEGFHKRVPS